LEFGPRRAPASGEAKPGRERIELREDGIDFTPADDVHNGSS
jgi:hypothetical protein